MNPSSFWRKAVVVLLLANLLLALWSGGFFSFLGWTPNPLREPQRLDDQVAPEALQLKTKDAPLAAEPPAAPVPTPAASE